MHSAKIISRYSVFSPSPRPTVGHVLRVVRQFPLGAYYAAAAALSPPPCWLRHGGTTRRVVVEARADGVH